MVVPHIEPSAMTSFSRLPLPQRLARRFGDAAASYDGEALAQRESATRLLKDLPVRGVVLDAGCGTGWMTAAMAARAEVTTVIALDIAGPMLRSERLDHPGILRLQADAAALPLASGTLDGLISNFALQWLQDPDSFAREAFRVLRPGGRFRVALPVAGSLAEVSAAWQSIGLISPVNEFAQPEDWMRAFSGAGFRLRREQRTDHVQHYPTLRALLRAVRDIGAGERTATGQSGIGGPSRLRALEDAAGAYRDAQGIPLRYHVLTLEGDRP